MKKTYWRGYLVAVIFALLTLAMTRLAKKFPDILDMFYPSFTRSVQDALAGFSAGFSSTLWQAIVMALVFLLIISILLLILLKKNFFRWLGWVLAFCSMLWMLHTGIHGLNYYASPLATDIRLTVTELTHTDVKNAAIFFRDQANALASELPRDEKGDLIFSDFDTLANQAGDGFENLVYDYGYSVFAGSTAPVKKLIWADLYSSMGICGISMALTGEASVNPQIPSMAQPFTMCHEMAHRMSIALEDDANLAGFLACMANESKEFQYSAYYMAYRYCISAMYGAGTQEDYDAAVEISKGASAELNHDLKVYNDFFNSRRNDAAQKLADSVNDAYIKVSGDKAGIASYGNVASLLVSWYIQNAQGDAQPPAFDPTNPDHVGLG